MLLVNLVELYWGNTYIIRVRKVGEEGYINYLEFMIDKMRIIYYIRG